MPKTIELSIDNLDKILNELAKVPDKFKAIGKRAMLEGMKVIETEAKKEVPVDTGHLRDSMKIVPGKTGRDYVSVVLKAGSDDETDRAYIAGFIEYGYTDKWGHEHAPNPFMHRAFEHKAKEANENIIENIGKELKSEGII